MGMVSQASLSLQYCSPVIPSQDRESTMNRMPTSEEALSDAFLPYGEYRTALLQVESAIHTGKGREPTIDTMQVPPMIASTAKYSRTEYLAPPRRREPIITGTILPARS